jgi:hypothetical protein
LLGGLNPVTRIKWMGGHLSLIAAANAAVGLRHPTIRDGDRHQGRRAPQTCSTRLSLAFYFCCAIVEEKGHLITRGRASGAVGLNYLG